MDLELTIARVRGWWRRWRASRAEGVRREATGARVVVSGSDPRAASLSAAFLAGRPAAAVRELRLVEPRVVAGRSAGGRAITNDDVARLLALDAGLAAGPLARVSALGVGLPWGPPARCCAEYAHIVSCDHLVDVWRCPLCFRRHATWCPNTDLPGSAS